MPNPRVQVLVCTNDRAIDSQRSCCSRRGGLEVYRALKDELRSRGLRQEMVATRTGCLRHCSRGVTVVCWPQNLWLGGVEVGDVSALVDVLEAPLESAGLQQRLAQHGLDRRTLPPTTPWE